MVTTGTFAFNPQASDLVIEAYDRIQIRASELTPDHIISARRSLNLVQVRWANRGVNLWAVDLQTVALVQGTGVYTVPAETVQVLDVYLRLTNSTTDRYLLPISRDEYAAFPNKTLQAPPTVFWYDRLIAPTVTLWPVPDHGATFTGTGSGTNLTASSVTGLISAGDPISGTGVPAGTTIVSQTSGTAGGAGVYVTSHATTSNSATITDNFYSLQYYRVRQIQDANPQGGLNAEIPYRFQEAVCADLAAHLSVKWKPEATQALLLYAQGAWNEASSEDRERVSTFISPQFDSYFR